MTTILVFAGSHSEFARFIEDKKTEVAEYVAVGTVFKTLDEQYVHIDRSDKLLGWNRLQPIKLLTIGTWYEKASMKGMYEEAKKRYEKI